MTKDKLKSVASRVRAVVLLKVQQLSKKSGVSWTDFGDPKDLEGACGYASWGLWKVIPGSTLIVGEWKGSTHCWVEYDGHIIDITATQFGFAPVRIVTRSGRAGKLYAVEARNRSADRDLSTWYSTPGWKSDLTSRLRKEGLL